MAVTQYIGARYVPLFSDPLDWDSTKAYEPLTIVYYLGNSYTSRQSVPVGIDIANNDYWAITGNYNAQIEAYRKEVQTYDGRITANAQAIADEVSRAVAEESAIKELITAEATRAKAAESELATGVSNALTRISEETEAREAADAALSAKIERSRFVKDYDNSVLVCIGDSILAGWSTENPSGIDAWDVYAGERLGFKPANVIKSCIGGAGWATGTTAQTLVNNAKTEVVSAGLDPDNVTAVVIAMGVNDSRQSIAKANVLSGASNAINAALGLFKNAEIHVFPMLMGNFGYSPQTQDVIDAVVLACSNLANVSYHEAVWTWNYDCPLSGGGVSSDRIHLLSDGEKRSGYNIARSMLGYNCAVLGAKVSVSDITGSETFAIVRSGGTMALTAAANYGTNASGHLWAFDTRYLNLQTAGIFTDGASTSTLVLVDAETKILKTFNTTFSSRGLYGSMAWPIKAEWNWIE